jgi:coenzyme F420-reducing hydrogenase delta subunit
MERLGLDKNRLHLAWISAAEGQKFASKIKEMKEIVDSVTKEEIEKTLEKLTPKNRQNVANTKNTELMSKSALL